MLAGQRMGINPGEILDGDPSEIMLEKALEDTERYQDDEIRPRNQRLRLPSISSDEDIDPLLFITDPSPSPTQLEPAQALDSERDLEGLSQTIIHGKSPQITSSQETPKGPARKRKLKGGHDSFIAQAMQEAIAAKLEMNDRREERRKQQFEAELELQREKLVLEKQEAEDRRERERREAEERREERLFHQNLILNLIRQDATKVQEEDQAKK
jgi:hypothetical protein